MNAQENKQKTFEDVINAWRDNDEWHSFIAHMSQEEKDRTLLVMANLGTLEDIDVLLESGANASSHKGHGVRAAVLNDNIPVARRLFEECQIIPWSVMDAEIERTQHFGYHPTMELGRFMVDIAGVEPLHVYMCEMATKEIDARPLPHVWKWWNAMLPFLVTPEVDTLEKIAQEECAVHWVPLFAARQHKQEMLDEVSPSKASAPPRKF